MRHWLVLTVRGASPSLPAPPWGKRLPSQHFVPHVFFDLDPMMVSTVVLCVTYGVIIWDKLNRAIVALLGAAFMIIVGALDQNEALKGVDWNTIGLLTGMMILVSISRRSGMFEYLAIWSAQKAKANPAGILLLLQITTGGTATLIGDPPNILIGSLVGLDFNAFIIHLAPVIVVIMAAQALMIHLLWGRALRSTPARRALVMGMSAKETIVDWTLLKQSLVILTVVIAAFVLARPLHLEPATIAMGGAALLMLLDNWQHHNEKQSANVHKTFGDVEWITIFFFVGLFIVVHGVEVGGLLHLLANALVAATGGDLATAGYAILWASAFLSAIVDNIPFVATMIPLIKSMAPAFGDKIEPLWWCLSLGACLGGNGTLIGASANLTVAGIAERNGVPFRFVTYILYGMPMMIVSIAISHIYVWWRYF